MKQIRILLLVVMTLLIVTGTAVAVPVKVQVAEFTVTGAANKDELKGALQSLLASRLTGNGVTTVEGGADLAAQVVGSYIAFGATFSIDATVKSGSGEILGRSFVQGNAPDDLIPAVGRLADQLRPILTGLLPRTGNQGQGPTVAPVVPTVAVPAAAVPAPPLPKPAAAGIALGTATAVSVQQPIVPTANVVVAPSGDIVRTAPAAQPMVQQERIAGALLGIAPGRPLAGGERELVVADARRVYLYRHGQGLKKIAEYALPGEGKILAVDTADLDADGQLEAYVTVMDREELVSVALAVTEQGLTPLAERLPYYFRALAIDGREKRLFAQQISSSDDFYGPVSEVVKKGNAYTLGAAVNLPAYANLFTFNRFTAADGKLYTVVFDRDGNLRVLDTAGKELWQGNDRFGGSEVNFQRDEQQMQNLALDRYRWRFIEQRLTIAPNGEIIVPRNSGLLVIGNSRSYSKNSVYAFAWNGAMLDERWHTKESANYLADYFYDAERKELVVLEQVQKEGLFSKGASTIIVKKVE